MGELKWFLIGFIVLYMIWLLGGGPSRNNINRTHPFMDELYKGGNVYTVDEVKNR
jgi:hypothetical protein